MHYIKLVKLLYMLDREALSRWGRTVTTDRYVSMDNGPVVSQIYDLITDEPNPDRPTVWSQFISRPEEYQVNLLREAPRSELSAAEENLIREIFETYGSWYRWKLVAFTHDFPEYTYPEGSSIPIEPKDILKAVGKTPAEIAEVEKELEFLSYSETVLKLR